MNPAFPEPYLDLSYPVVLGSGRRAASPSATLPYPDWPWDWDFRRNRPYKELDSDAEVEGEAEPRRGRSLRRKRSSDSLLSECLSEANVRHEQYAASMSRSGSQHSVRATSPFRPESPFRSDFCEDSVERAWATVSPFHIQMNSSRRGSVEAEHCPFSSPSNNFKEQKSPRHYASKIITRKSMELDRSGIVSTTFSSTPTAENGTTATGFDYDDEQGTCPVCHKYIGRPCDLRKHMKRHDRPYGCTFEPCQKQFGSKSDWKRHETTQHETPCHWLCDVLVQSKPCLEKYVVDGTFHAHLESHNLSEDVIVSKMRDCRLGARRFWCGFCRVPIHCLTPKPQDERFNHIDCHFMKEEKRIETWMPVSLARCYQSASPKLACTFCRDRGPHHGKVWHDVFEWRTHELSHRKMGKWRCDILIGEGENKGECGGQYPGFSDFVSHLRNSHELAKGEVNSKLESCRCVRDFKTFWCGFCAGEVGTKPSVYGSRYDRARHIGNHFVEDRKLIEQWVPAPIGSVDWLGPLETSSSSFF